jgi:S-methylmethionine-dependent homocysteine/selenocysteine methylase
MVDALARLLAAQDVVLLDGATGTELERRGFATPLPLWTAEAASRAPELLRQVHLDYLEAGADIITANTFRTNPYTLRRMGREAEAAALTEKSVALAREACRAAGHGVVAGCLAPLEDCYHPELVPLPEVLHRAHAAHATNLAAAGADLLLVETMGTAREAQAAAAAALATGLPVLVSFILDPRGHGTLLSGEDLTAGLAHLRRLAVGRARVGGFLVNCTPRALALAALPRMQDAGDPRPLGAYPNRGEPDAERGWKDDPSGTPAACAAWARDARARGARFLGGCCGMTPAHIRAMANAWRDTP